MIARRERSVKVKKRHRKRLEAPSGISYRYRQSETEYTRLVDGKSICFRGALGLARLITTCDVRYCPGVFSIIVDCWGCAHLVRAPTIHIGARPGVCACSLSCSRSFRSTPTGGYVQSHKTGGFRCWERENSVALNRILTEFTRKNSNNILDIRAVEVILDADDRWLIH